MFDFLGLALGLLLVAITFAVFTSGLAILEEREILRSNRVEKNNKQKKEDTNA